MAKTQHWTTEINASNFSWSLSQLIQGGCFTKSVIIWLRPASAHLLPPCLTALLPYGTHSNYIIPHTQWEPERGTCYSLKMFSSENFLILLLFLSDSLEWTIYRPFMRCFLWHLKLFFHCVPCYIVTGDWSTVGSHLVCLPCYVKKSPTLFNIPQSMTIGWGCRNLHTVLYDGCVSQCLIHWWFQ